MTIEDRINAALLKFLHKHGRTDAVEVTYWEDSQSSSGGCHTCEYTIYEVSISFRTDKDLTYPTGLYTHNGTFIDLIRELTD